MIRYLAWIGLALRISSRVFAQENFSVSLVPSSISTAPALHSCALGTWKGEWLIIGGRTNGLHGFLPPLAFPSSGINSFIYVFNPQSGMIWSSLIDTLPVSIREPITSSNMQFHQHDSTLYMVGGYGWKQSAADFITHPVLTAIHVPNLIQHVKSGGNLNSDFRQLTDSVFAVCGAHLGKIDSVYQLVWGHRFDGTYDRQDTTGFFTQTYTHEVRRFLIEDDGMSLSISGYSAHRDTVNYRRRDYNLVPTYFKDKSVGYTGFTGVFRKGINLPFLDVVNIHKYSDTLVPSFNQLMSQYHSAVMPVFDSTNNYMHSIFFGGMSMYFMDSTTGLQTVDSLVPFVNTVTKVTRDPSGSMSEFVLPIKMPSLMGTNAFFIPDTAAAILENNILDLNLLPTFSRVGWIWGGMTSPDPNISDTDPSLSWATTQLYEVWIDKSPAGQPALIVKEPVSVELFPNPSNDHAEMRVSTESERMITIQLFSLDGREVKVLFSGMVAAGGMNKKISTDGLSSGIYYLKISTGTFSKTIAWVIEK